MSLSYLHVSRTRSVSKRFLLGAGEKKTYKCTGWDSQIAANSMERHRSSFVTQAISMNSLASVSYPATHRPRHLCRLAIHLMIASCILLASLPTTSAAEMVLKTQTTKCDPPLRYWIYLPDEVTEVARSSKKAKSFPLVLFLHGGGEGGRNPEKVKKNGLPKLIAQGKSFPFIMVAPQNPSETQFWDDQQLIRLVNEIETKHPVNRLRVYLTGLSRGGYGAWRLAIQNPNRFAALVPVCGGGPMPYMNRIKHLPIWVFHGAKDTVIPISESQRLVEALKKAGGDVKFTIYPDAGHDAWTQAYDDPELYAWLLQQKRTEIAK
ncbi:prolyl oligopeptidase family serine peptidase [Rubripirellula obstinata]|uniref:carboxylesterase family protein n=1 Tax=Rubripirellula obstinata TaxID=406547 RepID=UPI00135B87E4|nr:prolyl oligopeptidase family serine peptidase [Rubripirellula obstinata]